MNPLHDQAPCRVIHQSYGEMLATAASGNYSFVNDFIEPNRDIEFYDQKIKEDYKSHYARLAQCLAIFWGVDQVLVHAEVEEFDFVIARQFDTVWKADGSDLNGKIRHIFSDHTQTLSSTTPDIQSIPIVYVCGKNIQQEDQFTEFPVVGAMQCTSFIFNRAAARIMKNQLFDRSLEELDIVYKQINTDLQSRLTSWELGYNIHRVFVKQDIHMIDINRHNVLSIPPDWNPDISADFAHIVRADCGKSD